MVLIQRLTSSTQNCEHSEPEPACSPGPPLRWGKLLESPLKPLNYLQKEKTFPASLSLQLTATPTWKNLTNIIGQKV